MMSIHDLIEKATFFKHTTSFWPDKVDFTTKARVEKSAPLITLGLIMKSKTFLLTANEALYYCPGAVFIARKCSGIDAGKNPPGAKSGRRDAHVPE